MSGSDAIGQAEAPACGRPQQDLVLYLYGEVPEADQGAVAGHAASCSACAEDLESLRRTLEVIDRSGIREAASQEPPLTWAALRARLQGQPAGALFQAATGRLLKAAAVVVLAGAAFLVGRYWEDIAARSGGAVPAGSLATGAVRPPVATGEPGDSANTQDAAWRLRVFSEQTNGYLDRTRLVLLEATNAESGPESESLRRVSRTLLRESRHARQVAERIDDRTLADLVGRIKDILEQISVTGGAGTIDDIRSRVNDSGVLLELEILSASGEPWAAERART